MSLYEKLDIVRKCPVLFLGTNSVSKLYIFISGLQFALPDGSPDLQTEGHLPFSYFNEYAAKRYNCSGVMGWANILLEICNGSEEDGLKLFFEMLDEFRALRIEKVWLLQLTEQNIHYNRTEKSVPRRAYNCDCDDYVHNNYIPLYSDAEKIYKIKLSDGTMLLAVKKETDGYARIERDSWYIKSSIDEDLERCFGEIVKSAWKESADDFSELLLLF